MAPLEKMPTSIVDNAKLESVVTSSSTSEAESDPPQPLPSTPPPSSSQKHAIETDHHENNDEKVCVNERDDEQQERESGSSRVESSAAAAAAAVPVPSNSTSSPSRVAAAAVKSSKEQDTPTLTTQTKSNEQQSSKRKSLELKRQPGDDTNDHWAEFSESFQENIGKPGRKALHDFFYPPRQQAIPDTAGTADTVDTNDDCKDCHAKKAAPKNDAPPIISPSRTLQPPLPSSSSSQQPPVNSNQGAAPPVPPPAVDLDSDFLEQERQDREYVENFWTAYDEIIILSLFSQFGIICRLAAANWFRVFDAVFRTDSALFVNLPLNCLSCFLMGVLSDGESLMQIINTRFTPRELQQEIQHHAHSFDGSDDGFEDDMSSSRHSQNHLRRRRRQPKKRRRKRFFQQQPGENDLQSELREVQLLALERRIRASPCLVLFPVKKENVDVVENYFFDGYQRNKNNNDIEQIPEEDSYSSGEGNNGLFDGQFSVDDYDLMLTEETTTTKSNNNNMGNLPVLRTPSKSTPDTAVAFGTPDIKTLDVVIQNMKTPDSQISMLSNHTSDDNQNLPPNNDSDGHEDDEPAISPQRPKNLAKVTDLSNSTEPDVQSSLHQDVALSHAEEGNLDPPLSSQGPDLATPRRTMLLKRQSYAEVGVDNTVDYGATEHPDIDQIISHVATDVTQKISRISRVDLADGWDVGTSPEEKSADLMLGLRQGLCGALSSFSSWISSMVSLLLAGQIGDAFVGLALGIQLPILAYRFGQNVAVYYFIWRCRRETRRDERRGYGIRISMDDDSEDGIYEYSEGSFDEQSGTSHSPRNKGKTKGRRTVHEEESETPSVRAISTALLMLLVVAECTALSFFYDPEDKLVALSLLFSPLGVLTRWRLGKFNNWRPNFPIGTFTCNIAACALSGTLGSILAGNPGPRERILLVSVIAGFGGTLSSVARFIVEILAGMDPILFRMDGIYYAVSSVFWGMVVSFAFSASVDWADATE